MISSYLPKAIRSEADRAEAITFCRKVREYLEHHHDFSLSIKLLWVEESLEDFEHDEKNVKTV